MPAERDELTLLGPGFDRLGDRIGDVVPDVPAANRGQSARPPAHLLDVLVQVGGLLLSGQDALALQRPDILKDAARLWLEVGIRGREALASANEC